MADDERPVGGAQGPRFEFPGEEEGIKDPVTGPPRFQTRSVSRTVTVGSSVGTIRLPQDAVFNGSGLSYAWRREPTWAGSGLVYNSRNHTITGTARLPAGTCYLQLRGEWRATGEVEDTQFRGNVNYDEIPVRITIRERNPLRLGRTQDLRLTAGQSLSAHRLASASGGVAPYRYSLVPLPGVETANLNTLGITYNAATNSLSASRVRGVYRTYKFQHRVNDACNRPFRTQVGQTFYIIVGAPARRPLILNNGRDIVLGGTVGRRFDETLPHGTTGGVAPLTWTFTMARIPPGNVQVSRSGNGRRKVRIYGTPSTAGTYRGTWSVRDSSSPARTSTVNVTITIIAAPTTRLTLNGGNDVTQSHPARQPGFRLDLPTTVSGGRAPYGPFTFRANLPRGLSFTQTGTGGRNVRISGTPTQQGTFRSTWSVRDSSSPRLTASIGIILTIVPGRLRLNNGNDVAVAVEAGRNLDYRMPRSVVGGRPPYRYDLSISNRPSWMTIRKSGTGNNNIRITGRPPTAGRWTGTYSVTDSASPRGSDSVGVTVVVNSASTLANKAFTWSPGRSVSETLPALLNPKGAVSYRYWSTGGLARFGLSVSNSTRLLSGTIPDPFPSGSTYTRFYVTATDAADGRQYTATYEVTVEIPTLTATAQTHVVVREGRDPRHRINPFTGGNGDVTYQLVGAAGSGLAATRGSGRWEIRGTAAQVGPSGRQWIGYLVGTDARGTVARARQRVQITDTPPARGFELPEDYIVNLLNNVSGTLELPRATSAGVEVTTGVTYTAVRISGEPASVASISGRTLTYNTGDQDRFRQAIWRRTATHTDGRTDSENVTIRILSRLVFPDPAPVNLTVGEAVPGGATTALRARGSGGVFVYSVVSQPSAASGVSVSISGSNAVVSGTPAAVGTYTAGIRCTTAGLVPGFTADATLTINVGTSTRPQFRLNPAARTYRARVGDTVEWALPEPENSSGSVSMAVAPPMPGGISAPKTNADGDWVVDGTITAPPATTSHTLTATDGASNTAQAALTVIIAPETDPEVLTGGCGPVEVVRTPRGGPVEPVLGSVLPLKGDIGPIRLFRPSEFAVAPGSTVSFDWTVAASYRGVPILEVDLWRTDPDMPFCAGIPNIQPTLSVEHEITSGYEIKVPETPGVYLYRLVALRGGSAGRYISADWWDCTILVTDDDDAIHISASKTAVPELFPVVLQWGFKGAQPTGNVNIESTPRRISPIQEITAASRPPAEDQGTDVGPSPPDGGRPDGSGRNGQPTGGGGSTADPGDEDLVDGTPVG